MSRALNCLHVEFTQIKTFYNLFGENWTINDLITKCVAEEEKLKKERNDLALLTFHVKPNSGKNSWKNKKNTHSVSHRYTEFRKPGNDPHHNIGGYKPVAFKKSFWCFWCKEKEHEKTDCHAFNAWLDNKDKPGGNHLAFVCFESNLVDILINSWWLDSGYTTHIFVSLHGFRNQRRPNLRENKLMVGNDLEFMVELMGDVSLVLGTGFDLVLKDTFYVPSFRRNLILVSCFDKFGFQFTFYDEKINLMLKSQIVGNGIM